MPALACISHLSFPRADVGYYGWQNFSRSGYRFAANESLKVTVEQADWVGVTFDDFKYMHGAIWRLQACAVPQHFGYAEDDFATGDLTQVAVTPQASVFNS